MKKRKVQKILAIMLVSAMTMSMVGGCGKQAGIDHENNTEETGDTGTGEQGAQESADGVAMGRYLEEVTDLSEQIEGYQEGLYRLSDGSMVITGEYEDFISSKDNGATWETDQREWRTDMLQRDVYVMDFAIGTDGTVGVIYDDQNVDGGDDEEAAQDAGADAGSVEGTEPESQSTEQTETGNQSAEETETENQSAESQESGSSENEEEDEDDAEPYELSTACMIIKPDGTEIPVEIEVTEDDMCARKMWIAENGRMFVTTLGTNIYEVFEDGSSEKFLTLEEEQRPELIQFLGNKMIIDGYDYEGLLIYDMEQKKYIEDEVLNDFVNENYGNRDWNGDSWYDLYFFPGEEDVLYLAGQKGLYRHVLGGSAMEQVIDGRLCSFNDPTYGLLGMVVLEDNEFMALFGGGRLVRFVYHPEVPTVPNESIKAYSLQDNAVLRRAITLYQTQNPEIFVEYEIGMEEGSSVTREDALKKLNTQIMAGEGPDLLILDDMPVTSYIDKGLLLDLSTVVDSLSGEEELFPNIVEAFRTDGKIYMIPYKFGLPVALADKAYVSQMDDLEQIAETIETLRADNPEKDLLNICSAKGIIKKFTPLCAPAWKTENGEVDKEAVWSFLDGCKRIYDAQMEGISEETVDKYEEVNESYIEYYGETREDMEIFSKIISTVDYLTQSDLLEVGSVDYAYEYSDITSVPRTKGFENTQVALISGQSQHVFYPDTMVGISAASTHTQQAEGLLRVLLGKENGVFDDFVTNRAAFEENLLPDQYDVSDDEPFSYWSYSDEDGIYFEGISYWMNEEKRNTLRGWVETAQTPYLKDAMLEETICTEGVKYIEGSQSMEDTMDAIEKKVSLYMAE